MEPNINHPNLPPVLLDQTSLLENSTVMWWNIWGIWIVFHFYYVLAKSNKTVIWWDI